MTVTEPMSEDNNYPLDEQTLNHLCWYLVSTRNDFFPPDEQAELAYENLDASSEAMAYEEGYFAGGMAMMDDAVRFLEAYDIDVEKRAKRYVREDDDLDLEPPKSKEELLDEYE